MDTRRGSRQVTVGLDARGRRLETGGIGKLGARHEPGGDQHEVGGQGIAVIERQCHRLAIALQVRNGASQPHFDAGAAVRALRPVWPVLLLMVLVVGGLYGGIATPTEIGAVGAAGALAITVLMRRLGVHAFADAVADTLSTTVMIVTIVIGAMMFGYFLTLTQATQSLFAAIQDAGLAPWMVIAVLVLIYLVLGMFMDQIAILVLTVPVTYALISQLGYDGIWYGIVITKTVEIGLVTPPLGLNVFVTSGITGVSVADCFRGVAPFLLVEFVVLGLLLAFPEISLFLPNLMS